MHTSDPSSFSKRAQTSPIVHKAPDDNSSEWRKYEGKGTDSFLDSIGLRSPVAGGEVDSWGTVSRVKKDSKMAK